MNIQNAKNEIVHTIKAYTAKNDWGGYNIPSLRQRPILLIGPPGIGKTAIMSQAAAECNIGFVSYTMTHHTRQSAMGLPFIEHRSFGGQEYTVTEYTMSEILASVYQTIEESGNPEGLLFLDEINCVSETLAPAMLQFLQNKTFGNHRLPEGWILAAAGNPAEYNKSVRDFDIATLDRMKYISVEADVDAWRSYALSAGIHGAILSYLTIHPENFYQLKQSFSKQVFVTARGWEDLSCILQEYESLQLAITEELIMEYLHLEDLSHDFCGFYHWYQSASGKIPVPEMLLGDAGARTICQDLLVAASNKEQMFQEQVQLIHGILSCIHHAFCEYQNANAIMQGLKDYQGQLTVFQKQQSLPQMIDAVNAFLTREKDVLRIRREHNLSTEEELRHTQHMLYLLRSIAYDYHAQPADCFENYLKQRVTDYQQKAEELVARLHLIISNAIAMLEEHPQKEKVKSAATLLLASLSQDQKLQAFLRRFPNNTYRDALSLLDFQAQERELLASLQ